MAESLFSASWYRVAGLTPRLRSHAEIHRHRYRGQTWYVLEDRSTERFHRFSSSAYLVIGLMDGRRTVQELWDVATARLGDDAPTQDEMIQLLAQLHAADVLQCDAPPVAAELLQRGERQRRRLWQMRLFNLLAFRIPLWDPDRFLNRVVPWVRPLVGWTGSALWLAVVGPALVLVAVHWSALTGGVVDRVLTPQNLLLLWLCFPVVKALHELGHAVVTKAFGGEVHDMGVMLLVLTPVPYVDASSAWAFRDKRQRMAVGAAGMLVELFLAALALGAWLAAEPGTVRAIAYNVIFIAGVSTVVFNANPLLRYDGYYILSDYLEIPNLRSRASAYLGYLAERYLFGRGEAEFPGATPGERGWFVVYAVLSFVYRTLVAVAIVLFIASRLFFVGVLLAIGAAAGWVGAPLVKGTRYLVSSPRLRRVRRRALAVSGAAFAAVVALIGLAPAPSRTQTEGVIWLPDEAIVRAGTEGFIEAFVARPGSHVRRGDPLIRSSDPQLTARLRIAEARVVELEARYAAERPADRVKAEIIKEELQYAAETVTRARQRAGELVIRSRAEGTFVVPQAEDLPGRFAKRGELLGYVVAGPIATVRAVVAQEDVELVRHRTRAVEIRLAERVAEVVLAVVRREVPGASERLPTAALGSLGGGRIAVDPANAEGVKALSTVFQVDLELPASARAFHVGERVHVRFDHGWEPLAAQWYRKLRQLFLARFHV
jgi:putative peptide zinc metalloprotease protein